MQRIRRLLVVLVLAGCSSTGQMEQKKQSTEDIFVLGLVSEYEPGQAFGKVTRPLVEKCMTRKGFRYSPPEVLGPTTGIPTDSDEYLEEWGYGVSTMMDPRRLNPLIPKESPQNAELSPADVKYQVALFGNDQSPGCGTTSIEEFFGKSRFKELQQTQKRLKKKFAQLEDSDTGREARSNWSKCLKEAGYNFVSPAAAKEFFVEKTAKSIGQDPNNDGERNEADRLLTDKIFEALRAEERSAGKADAFCRNKHYVKLRAKKERLINSELVKLPR